MVLTQAFLTVRWFLLILIVGTVALQETIVDLTSLPDDEVVVVGTSSAGPSKKRRKNPIVLPESPNSQSRASKCGICFHDMDDKMSCGPCG
jgi:hypothetical protein